MKYIQWLLSTDEPTKFQGWFKRLLLAVLAAAMTYVAENLADLELHPVVVLIVLQAIDTIRRMLPLDFVKRLA